MTKTLEQLQAAVDEMREVCKKHGVVLLGTCESEGIYGEITIAGASKDEITWRDPESVLDNKVVYIEYSKSYRLGGIGDL